ncbi:Histidine protein methyltransferase 1 [Chytriomyces hyalinus]|nr:Histidine protein methyltransferase 1 [Chytriomyces hyalinus]
MSFRFGFGEPAEQQQQAPASADASIEFTPSFQVQVPTADTMMLVMGEHTGRSGIVRRCLADVKLDAASEDHAGAWVDSVMLQNTDLINGVYEGGFKTWECSLDLVALLASLDSAAFTGKRVLELGCGSALPGLYCLTKGSHVDFQDYNELVIRLVTMPNAAINTVAKPASEDVDANGTFEVEVQLSLLNTLPCRFFAGDWGSLNSNGLEQYDLILTSETIYSTEAHAKLHDVMKRSLKRDGRVLIAAKKTYFGCSGDLQQFLSLVHSQGVFRVETLQEFTSGVHRVIIQLTLA